MISTRGVRPHVDWCSGKASLKSNILNDTGRMSGSEMGVGVQENFPGKGSRTCKGPGVKGKGYSCSRDSEDELALRSSQMGKQAKQTQTKTNKKPQQHTKFCPVICQNLQIQVLNLRLLSTHGRAISVQDNCLDCIRQKATFPASPTDYIIQVRIGHMFFPLK